MGFGHLSWTCSTWVAPLYLAIFASGQVNNHGGTEQVDALRPRPVTTDKTVPATTTVANFPTPPSSIPTQSSVLGAGIDRTWSNVSILPPKFSESDFVQAAPFTPTGLSIVCKDCSIKGAIDVTQGISENSQPSSDSNKSASIIDFYEDGFLQLTVNGFGAHIELEVTVEPSGDWTNYTVPFPDIPIPGLGIQGGLVSAGLVFRPSLLVGFKPDAKLDFTYGFNLTVPDESRILLDIKDTTNSTVTGFRDARFDALPFNAHVERIGLTVYAAFEPQLLLTIAPTRKDDTKNSSSQFDFDASINAGFFLALPQLTATIEQVANVDEHCNPLPANATLAAGDKNAGNITYPGLTHIVPSIDFNAGVLANAHLEGLGIDTEDEFRYTALNASRKLQTTCISYDSAIQAFVSPTPTGKDGKPLHTKESGGSSLPRSQPTGISSAIFLGLVSMIIAWT